MQLRPRETEGLKEGRQGDKKVGRSQECSGPRSVLKRLARHKISRAEAKQQFSKPYENGRHKEGKACGMRGPQGSRGEGKFPISG